MKFIDVNQQISNFLNHFPHLSDDEKLTILEAIQLTNKFPTPKKVLIERLEEMIHEQLDLIDKEELNNYIHAKK